MNLQGLKALVKMELKKLIRQPTNLFLILLFPAVTRAIKNQQFYPSSAIDLSIYGYKPKHDRVI